MEVCRITLPIDPNLTSPNRNPGWRKLAKLKSIAHTTARICWVKAGRPQVDFPIIVHYIVRRGTAMDDDNIIAGLKPVRDGLFKDAITPDDSAVWVKTGDVTQEIGPMWKKAPEVIAIVEAR
jgi:hypothetical protein